MATWRALFAGGVSANARLNVSEETGLGNNAPLIVIVAESAAFGGAPENGRLALLRELLTRGADVNARAHNGYTVLRAATRNAEDNGQTAQILLDAGARVNPDDAWLLRNAAKRGDLALVQRALKLGVRADSKSARHLLQAALDIRGKSLNEDTPILETKDAVARAQITKLLIDAGAAVNDFDELSQTPIMLAADGSLRPDLVELLLKAGADPNLRGDETTTVWNYAMPLRFYTQSQIERALQMDPFAIGDMALDPDAAQQLARATEDTRTLALLLGAGASLEGTDARGSTPLMLAAQNNRAASIAFLVARGANIEAADKTGNTALHRAAGADAPDAVAALLDAGANIEARNQDSQTPLLVAAGAGVEGITYYGPISMIIEGYLGGPEALRALTVRGASLRATNARGATALHYVVKSGDTKSAQLLIMRGANINARSEAGVTALHVAVSQGDYSMSQLLLKLGADTKLKIAGQSALDIARTSYVTEVTGAENDSSRETQEMLANFKKRDREITAQRQQIARLLEQQQLK